MILTGSSSDDKSGSGGSGQRTGPGVNASVANQFAAMLAAAGRATVINRTGSASEDEIKRLAQQAGEQERKTKEAIEAQGLPPGKFWWEMR